MEGYIRGRNESCSGAGSKAYREKMRRDKMNDRFIDLSSILEPGRPEKTEKSVILNDAICVLNQLRVEAQELKEANEKLQEDIKNLKNLREMIFNIFFMFFNLGLTAYLIGNMTNLVVHGTSRTRKFRDTIQSATSFVQRNQLPPRVQEQMLAHLCLKFRTDYEGLQQQDTIDSLPKPSDLVFHILLNLF